MGEIVMLGSNVATRYGSIDRIEKCGSMIRFIVEAEKVNGRISHRARRAAVLWLAIYQGETKGIKHYRFDLVRPDGSRQEDAF